MCSRITHAFKAGEMNMIFVNSYLKKNEFHSASIFQDRYFSRFHQLLYWILLCDILQGIQNDITILIHHATYECTCFRIYIKDTVFAAGGRELSPKWLDSSTIDLCLSLFPWAKFRKKKAAEKMHTLLDLRGSIPTFIEITDGKVHDVNVLDLLLIEPRFDLYNGPCLCRFWKIIWHA